MLDGTTGRATPWGQYNRNTKAVAARRPDGGRSTRQRRQATIQVVRPQSRRRKFLATVEADNYVGTYVDPRAGKITLNEYAETFMAAQVWRKGHGRQQQSHIDNHIGPALGNRQLATITRTDVQAFVASLTAKGLAPTTVHGIHVRLVSILEAAVHDGKIVRSPAVKIRLPKTSRPQRHRL